MNNPFSVLSAPEPYEDALDQQLAPLIDYPAMRPGQAVATLGRKVQAYVTAEGSAHIVSGGLDAYPSQQTRRGVDFVEMPALPGYVTRQSDDSERSGFLVDSHTYTLAAEDLRTVFELVAELWIHQTEYESSLLRIFTHRAYEQILRMGGAVIPFILPRLHQEPERWAPALAAITKLDPVPAGASADEAVAAWRDWAHSRGYAVGE